MLSRELAQNISKKMMEVIPYNVNIMNEKGVIIGSGDKNRIGNIHKGAVETLEKKCVTEVYKDVGGVKSGVNTPIFFRGNVIGVIGITGDPEDVRQFSKLVSITAELLINQEYTLNEYIIKKKIEEEYIYELLYSNKEYDNDFIQRGKSLGIDLTKKRAVIILDYEREDENFIKVKLDKIISSNEHFINISNNRFAIIAVVDDRFNEKVNRIDKSLSKYKISIGVGSPHKILQNSLIEGIEALNIGQKLYEKNRVNFYSKIKLFYYMDDFFFQDENEEIMNRIRNEGEELLETFIAYFDMNGEKNKIADKLHIHRNTLNYRLKKIEEATSLNLENYIDLFQYLSSYISYKLNN
ncbi:sugar diacid recognition domain-containing protein [Clostridium baratii]|uniref:CdaR family transcriptional regulator n=1 Tax=Clostridium baratii TaxID=1561 RepID=UPI0006BB0B3A|nr:sugar diacid recognition domain-containing protein [Clostridium baratii]